MRKAPSVVFIREVEQQMSSSGCCGRLSGEFRNESGGEPVFAERREMMEKMGPLYRTLRDRFGESVAVQVVDPRNLPSLLYILARDFWNYDVGFRDATRTLFRLPVCGLLLNGRLIGRGEWPSEDEIVDILDALLAPAPERRKTQPLPERGG